MDELFDEFALVTIKPFDFAAKDARRVDFVELLLQSFADGGFTMAHENKGALGIIEILRRDSRPCPNGGVEAFKPVSIAWHGRPTIAEDYWENVLFQFDGEFECAAMKTLKETLVRPRPFRKKMNQCADG